MTLKHFIDLADKNEMVRGSFFKLIGLSLSLNLNYWAAGAQASPCEGVSRVSFLRSVFSTEIKAFDQKFFAETLAELNAKTSAQILHDFKLGKFQRPEAKLALFESIQGSAGAQNGLNFSSLLESANPDQLRRIEQVMNLVKFSPKNGVSSRLAKNAIQDLYHLAHPVESKGLLQNLLPPQVKDAEALIESRFEMQILNSHLEKAMLDMGIADTRNLESMRAWFQTHANLRNTLLSSAVKGSPAIMSEILSRASKLAVGRPDFASYLLNFPKIKFFELSANGLEQIELHGTQALLPELKRHFKNTAMAELYYDYVRKKLNQAVAVYYLYYACDHWQDQAGALGSAKLLVSNAFVTLAKLQEASDHQSVSERHRMQVRSSLQAEFAEGSVPAPARIYQVTEDNLNLADREIKRQYLKDVKSLSQSGDGGDGLKYPLTPIEIVKAGREALLEIRKKEGISRSEIEKAEVEFNHWAKTFLKADQALERSIIEVKKPVSSEQLWEQGLKAFQTIGKHPQKIKPHDVADLLLTHLNRQPASAEREKIKLEIRKKALLN